MFGVCFVIELIVPLAIVKSAAARSPLFRLSSLLVLNQMLNRPVSVSSSLIDRCGRTGRLVNAGPNGGSCVRCQVRRSRGPSG